MQGRIQGGVLGVKPLLFLGNFFNLLGLFQIKIPKYFPPPKFSLPYKSISKPLPRKISGYATGYMA